MSESKNIFQKLEQEYKIAIDNTNSALKRLSSANLIAKEIINYSLNKDERKNDKDAINKERQRRIDKKEILNPEFKDRPYGDNLYGSLDFLCALGYIPSNLKYAFGLLLSRGYKNSKSPVTTTMSDISFLSIHEILNNILDWFLSEENQSSHYLIPVGFMSKNDPVIEDKNDQKINTFWNIRAGETSWFKKYRTPLSYGIALLPILFVIYVILEENYLYEYDIYFLEEMDRLAVLYLFALIYIPSLLVSIVELYKTYKYATKKKVRLFRYLLFGTMIFPVILAPALNLFGFSFNSEEQYSAFLDPDPNDNAEGFLFLTTHNCLPTAFNSCKEKSFSLDSIVVPKGANKMFDLRMELKNIGNKSLDSSRFYFSYFFPKENKVFIQANVQNSMENSIYDVVTIHGFEKGSTLVYTDSKIIFTMHEYDSYGMAISRDSIVYSQFQKDFKTIHGAMLPTLNPASKSRIKKVTIVFCLRVKEENSPDYDSNSITGYRISD